MRLVFVLFVVSLATFFIVDLVPGDPAIAILGSEATPEQVAEVHAVGLDDPVLERYLDWIGGALRGDLGNSLVRPAFSVSELLALSIPITLQLAAMALAVQPAHRHCRQRAGVQLAFGADVVQPRAEGHRRGQAGEDQRRRARQRLGQREARAEAAFQQQRVGLPDRGAGPGHQQRRDQQRERQRRRRRGQQQRGGTVVRRSSRIARASAVGSPAPAIASPIADSVQSRGRPRRCQPPGVHHGDAVGEREHLVQVLADQQHGAAGGRRVQQLLVHIGHGADVQAPGRLAGDDQPRRAAGQRAPEDQLLHVAADSARAGVSSPPASVPRTSKRSTMPAACARAAARRTMPARAKRRAGIALEHSVLPQRQVADRADRVPVLRDAGHAGIDERGALGGAGRGRTQQPGRAAQPAQPVGQGLLAVAGDAGDRQHLAGAQRQRRLVHRVPH